MNNVTHINGYSFAGATLTITEVDSPSTGNQTAQNADPSDNTIPGEVSDVKSKLQSFLERRYDPAEKLLNLRDLMGDSDLSAMGIFEPNVKVATHAKVFAALMKVCDEAFKTPADKRAVVDAVSLADNALADIAVVTTLAPTFPSLKKLSLANNNIQSTENLKNWRWKFRDLEVLDLLGNPISNHMQFKDTMLQWYPKLQILNGTTVRTREEIAAKGKSPIPIMGPHFQDEAQICEGFIKAFFPVFDDNRDLLIDQFYDEHSTFSVSVNNSLATGTRDTNLQPYVSKSRNLLKVTHLPTRVTRSHTGADNIRQLWRILPKTKHPSLIDCPVKWLIECHPLPGLPDLTAQSLGGVGGFIIMVHGEFSEVNVATSTTQDPKSFDRTFVVGPGDAARSVRVVSDILCLRPPDDAKDAFVTWLQPKSEEEQLTERLITELMVTTRLKREHAIACLQKNHWNPADAWEDYERLRVCISSCMKFGHQMLIHCQAFGFASAGGFRRDLDVARSSNARDRVGRHP